MNVVDLWAEVAKEIESQRVTGGRRREAVQA